MDSSDLIEMLEGAGVAPDVARNRAQSYVREQADNERFEKSLTALEDVALAQREAEELHNERLHKAFEDGQSSIAEAMAPALDALLTEQRAQNEALCKGLTGVLELVKSLKSEVKELRSAPQVQEPIAMAKSVQSYIPSPADRNAESVNRDDLLKSIVDISTNDPKRAQNLMQAAALLESGADPSDIKSRFNV